MFKKGLLLAGSVFVTMSMAYADDSVEKDKTPVIDSPSLSIESLTGTTTKNTKEDKKNDKETSGSNEEKAVKHVKNSTDEDEKAIVKIHHIHHHSKQQLPAPIQVPVIENYGQPGDINTNITFLEGDVASWENVARDIVNSVSRYLPVESKIYIPPPQKKSSEFVSILYSLLKTSFMEHGYMNITEHPEQDTLIYSTHILKPMGEYPQVYLDVSVQDKLHMLTSMSRVYSVRDDYLFQYKGRGLDTDKLNEHEGCIQFLTPDYYGDGIQLNCLIDERNK